MSKIGKKLIEIPAGVSVIIEDKEIQVKGPLGELKFKTLDGLNIAKDNGKIKITAENQRKQTRSNWGTARSLLWNAVLGVTQGFVKKLILEGIGYKIMKEGDNLNLSLGFSHPVKFQAPAGIDFEVEKNSILTIKGFDKELVGQTAAKIRSLKKPEPYKGKGFRYEDEVLRRKAGKRAVTVS